MTSRPSSGESTSERPPANSLRRGVLPLLTFAVLTAGLDVYAGNRLETADPAQIAAVSFTLTAVFFAAVEWRRCGTRLPAMFLPHRRDLVAINITTAVTWLTMFYALDYLEPAIVNVMGLALGPVIMVFAGPMLRRNSAASAMELVVSVSICLLLGGLMWTSFSGRSGLGELPAVDVVLGMVFTLVCAVGSAVNIIYMKRLSDAGCHPGTVLAGRFILTSVAAWTLTLLVADTSLSSALVPGGVIAVLGVGLPIYVLQIGVRYTEPITTSLLIALSPLFAFVMQFADGRLRFSLLTLGGVVGVVVLVVGGVLARRERRPEPGRARPEAVTAREEEDRSENDQSGGHDR